VKDKNSPTTADLTDTFLRHFAAKFHGKFRRWPHVDCAVCNCCALLWKL